MKYRTRAQKLAKPTTCDTSQRKQKAEFGQTRNPLNSKSVSQPWRLHRLSSIARSFPSFFVHSFNKKKTTKSEHDQDIRDCQWTVIRAWLTSLRTSALFSSEVGSWSSLFIRLNFLSLIEYPGTVSFFKALCGIAFGVALYLSDGWTGEASGGGVSVLLRFVRFGVL